jgi:hypothetical protein
MKKTTLIIMCIAVLSLFCILAQTYAQDAGTGLFSHTPVRLLNPAGERISSVLTEPPSPPDRNELTPESLIGMFDSWASRDGLLGANPALEMIKAMMAGSEPQPSEPPATNPGEQFGGWNPFSINWSWGDGHNLWFGNVNFTLSEPWFGNVNFTPSEP